MKLLGTGEGGRQTTYVLDTTDQISKYLFALIENRFYIHFHKACGYGMKIQIFSLVGDTYVQKLQESEHASTFFIHLFSLRKITILKYTVKNRDIVKC